MRILSINVWPMGSCCPIGYLGEHLFNDSRFEVLEFVSRDVPVYREFTKRYIVDFNKSNLSLCVPQTMGCAEGGHPHVSFVKTHLKTIIKYLNPMNFDSRMRDEVFSFRPEVVYTQGYDIRVLIAAKKLADYIGVPCVTHTLDWWFSDFPLVRRLQLSVFKSCISASSKHLAGSPKMADWIEKKFHVTTLFVSNCCSILASKNEDVVQNDKNTSGALYLYTGNLTPCRHLSLNVLSHHLHPGSRLVVYAPPEQIRDFNLDSRIEVHSSVSQDEMPMIYNQADVLVHVESFDDSSMGFARYSLSTKVAEYLATGKPILYYGPKDIGVGDFFYRTGCAYAAYDESEIDLAISRLEVDSEDSIHFECRRAVFNDLFERNKVHQHLMLCLDGK